MAQTLKNLMGVGVGAQTARQIIGLTFDGLAATGTTQADALSLPGDVNVVTTVAANSGVRLPNIPQPGDEFAIANLGANALNIYPGTGGSIQGGAVNLPYVLNVGASAVFIARAGSKAWAVVSSGGTAPSPPVVGSAALKFNLASNSMYVPILPF